jgi:pyruvate/2-oxoglutarate dehydrogenase complex dihydrolipoamide acyltransferase (E2) component
LPRRHHELRLPELGLTGVPVQLSMWLVERGATVIEGDRLVEIVAGCVTVDLPSPANGTLWKIFVAEDDPLEIGQLLAIVEGEIDEDAA